MAYTMSTQGLTWLPCSTMFVCELQSMQAVKLRDSLDVVSDTKPFMSYRELLDFIVKK